MPGPALVIFTNRQDLILLYLYVSENLLKIKIKGIKLKFLDFYKIGRQ